MKIKAEVTGHGTSFGAPLPNLAPREPLSPHIDEARPLGSPWRVEDETSQEALTLSDIRHKFQEYIPRWNQEFAERMRSVRVSCASLFQEDRSILPERASIPSAFQREGISGFGTYPIPAIPSLLQLFHPLLLLFQRIAQKTGKDKALKTKKEGGAA
jgi:hypothetical protein